MQCNARHGMYFLQDALGEVDLSSCALGPFGYSLVTRYELCLEVFKWW